MSSFFFCDKSYLVEPWNRFQTTYVLNHTRRRLACERDCSSDIKVLARTILLDYLYGIRADKCISACVLALASLFAQPYIVISERVDEI